MCFCLQLQLLTTAAMSLSLVSPQRTGSSQAHSACRFVGVGFLVPQVINYSMMVGAVLFFGILLPLIHNKAGQWYPAGQHFYCIVNQAEACCVVAAQSCWAFTNAVHPFLV